MSRHKFVKALDLDEELEDFDGAEEDGFEEELTPEAKELLRQGTIEVRTTLGPDFTVSDKEIEDSLYYYYYDVPKSVNYLLDQRSRSASSKKTKPKAEAKADNDNAMPVSGLMAIVPSSSNHVPFSAEDFFKDSPWLNIPVGRRGYISIEPLYPRGGLLGGSPSQGASPPKSKLAALAAARKKKENQRLEGNTETISSIALLDKLGGKPREIKPAKESKGTNADLTIAPAAPERSSKRYPPRKQKSPDLPPTQPSDSKAATEDRPTGLAEKSAKPKAIPAAAPSIFAKTICSLSSPVQDILLGPMNSLFSSEVRNQSDTNLAAFSVPSPDDIVLKAQSSSKGTKTAGASQATTKDKDVVEGLAGSVKDITINEPPKIKSKNLDVIHEYQQSQPRRFCSFVVIGHVDAGKSTLMGRLLYDLNVIDKRTIDKYRKEAESIGKASFALAWVLDQGTEERERGVTIDTANHHFTHGDTVFTILDAPGHRDFVPNMIAGASQADFAVLVLDASTGNFESGLENGQTREHAMLVRSMGVKRIVVAVNKLDSLAWSQSRFEEIRQQTLAFLTTIGFPPANISFVPCSGLTGDNIVRPSTSPNLSWHTNNNNPNNTSNPNPPTLLSLLSASPPLPRNLHAPFHLEIDDLFRGSTQTPLSISGLIQAGTVQIGDTPLLLPASIPLTIKGIETPPGHPTDWAVAGQHTILHLSLSTSTASGSASDIDPTLLLRPGDILCSPLQHPPIPVVRGEFTAKILAFEFVMPMPIEVHRGRMRVPGRVTQLVCLHEKRTGERVVGGKGKVRGVRGGEVATVRVEVEGGVGVPLEKGMRVVLRAEGRTVGAGQVL